MAIFIVNPSGDWECGSTLTLGIVQVHIPKGDKLILLRDFNSRCNPLKCAIGKEEER